MKIEKATIFKVGSCQFNTEEEAKSYIASKEYMDETFSCNLGLLQSSSYLFVPCLEEDDGVLKIRLFSKKYNNFDQGEGWEDILENKHLKYVESRLTLLSSSEFINKFLEISSELVMETENLGELIVALRWHLSQLDNKAELFEKVFNALEHIQYSPVVIYD